MTSFYQKNSPFLYSLKSKAMPPSNSPEGEEMAKTRPPSNSPEGEKRAKAFQLESSQCQSQS